MSNWKLILVASALLVPVAARAERNLTLDEAFQIAEKSNLDLAAARPRLDSAALDVRQALAALLPTAALQGKYTHNYKEVSLNLGPDKPPAVIQQGEQLDGALNVAVPLVTPYAYPGLDAAKQSEQLAKETYTLTKTQVLFGVAQAFYAAAGTDELVAARNHAVEVAQQTLKQAQTRFENGITTRLEVSRAELAVVQAEKTADESKAAQSQAYRGLATLLQVREPIHVVSGEIAATAGESAKRPEIAVLEQSLLLTNAQEKSAQFRWLPTLSGFGTGRLSNYKGFAGDNYSWALGLQLDWAIYDGGLRDVQVQKARASRIETEAKLKLQQDQITDEVANAKEAVETKTRSVTAAQRSVQLSRESLDLVRVRYEAGQATQLDVLQSQDSLVVAEVGMAQARFDLALAHLSLRRASGSFLSETARTATN